MKTKKMTPHQAETLCAVRDGRVVERKYGYGAWRINGATPGTVGKLVRAGLVRWGETGGGDVRMAYLTEAGVAATPQTPEG